MNTEAGAVSEFRRLASENPELPLLLVDGKSASRGGFLEGLSRWAQALARAGVGAGDRILLVLPNGLLWYEVFWGAVALRATPVPLDPQTGTWELGNLVHRLRPKVCIFVPRWRSVEIACSLVGIAGELLEPPTLVCSDSAPAGSVSVDEFLRDLPGDLSGAKEGQAAPSPKGPSELPHRILSEEEPLMLACTSGTTDNPKIIEVPHLGFWRAQRDMAKVLDLSAEDRMLLGMPLYHQGGFGMGLQMLIAGGSASYRSIFDPVAFLETIQSERITVLQLSPTLAKLILSTPDIDRYDLSSLRLCYFAGEVLPDEVAAGFWKKRGIRVVNIIGSSETATMVIWDSRTDTSFPVSEFRALPFTRIRVLGKDRSPTRVGESGHLWVHTDALLTEYVGNEEETRRRIVEEEGIVWFDTQDLVVPTPSNRVQFVGRAKRVIKRGGNLIYPEEVESYLLTHPGVAAVAVLSQPHELFGEMAVAHVQLAPGFDLNRSDLLNYCRGQIAAYKIPDRFVFTDHVPIGIGKTEFKKLRQAGSLGEPPNPAANTEPVGKK